MRPDLTKDYQKDKFLVWKNYFPPDTTKKDSAVIKTDSLKTSSGTGTDSAGANTKIDTTKKNSVTPDMKEPDSLKK